MADIDISVYSAAAVAEDIGRELYSVELNNYEEAGLAEDVELNIAYVTSAVETVSVTDSPTVEIPFYFYTDSRNEYTPRQPVRKLSAEFERTITQGTLRIPVRSISAFFGAMLEEKIPTRSLVGSIAVDTYIFTSGSMTIPFPTVEGYMGAILDERVANRSVVATMYESSFSLDKKYSAWKLSSGVMVSNDSYFFLLSKYIPVRTLSASITFSQEIGMVLEEKIPGALKISASMYEVPSTVLNGKIPVRTLDGQMYSNSFILEESIPVWIAGAFASGDALSGSIGTLAEESVYDDYILRYIRP